ncbi:ER membrane protein complex subunit 3-like [Zophobas morio]|uniref:ER membrane protein complex subunit 3-like n=1 Tax=Zophobas morio TaxID=2755281 RepID=UPI003082F57B
MSADLVVDSQIRSWVFLPIVVITFLVGILRHYISLLISGQKKLDQNQLRDSQILVRARVLRENAKFIPKAAFILRKQAFNKDGDGYLTRRRPPSTQNLMTDPTLMTDMLKGNLTNVLPMIIIGGWINWMFSGFITTKVPFPLTLRFKSMLQRGIELTHLDASWVSSASWYFLNVFGLRSIYTLVLGENNAADQNKQMEEQMSGAAITMPNDANAPFKAEWEALEILDHHWVLEGVEGRLLRDNKKCARKKWHSMHVIVITQAQTKRSKNALSSV